MQQDNNAQSAGIPWVRVELAQQLYAIPAQHVRELVINPSVTEAPGLPRYARGVMNLRGKVIPVIDLRERLGMVSRRQEAEDFCAMMAQREQDHVAWMTELEASVREGRKFGLTTDPHQCAFGRWYYSVQTKNAWLANLLKRFEAPHTQIHETAIEVAALLERGDQAAAIDLVEERRRDVLSGMITLFGRLREMVQEASRETVVIVETGARRFAVTVDAAHSLERFSPQDIEPLPVGAQGPLQHVWRKGPTGTPVLLLNAEYLLDTAPIARLSHAPAAAELSTSRVAQPLLA